LINKGANVNARSGDLGNDLQAALYKGNEAEAEILLDNSAEVNAWGG
jgi:hypothetical protein